MKADRKCNLVETVSGVPWVERTRADIPMEKETERLLEEMIGSSRV
jgi:hypothetical protein